MLLHNTDPAWKKLGFRFRFFPGAGHALDPRESYLDVVFHAIPPARLEEVAGELDAYLK